MSIFVQINFQKALRNKLFTRGDSNELFAASNSTSLEIRTKRKNKISFFFIYKLIKNNSNQIKHQNLMIGHYGMKICLRNYLPISQKFTIKSHTKSPRLFIFKIAGFYLTWISSRKILDFHYLFFTNNQEIMDKTLLQFII